MNLNYTHHTAISIDNYTIIEPRTKSVTLSEENPNQELVFFYKKNKIYESVTVNYTDKYSQNHISDSKVYSNLEFWSYSYEAISIPNYTLVIKPTIIVILTEESDNLAINFEYEKNQQVITSLNQKKDKMKSLIYPHII